jgi:hypothetical protein
MLPSPNCLAFFQEWLREDILSYVEWNDAPVYVLILEFASAHLAMLTIMVIISSNK